MKHFCKNAEKLVWKPHSAAIIILSWWRNNNADAILFWLVSCFAQFDLIQKHKTIANHPTEFIKQSATLCYKLLFDQSIISYTDTVSGKTIKTSLFKIFWPSVDCPEDGTKLWLFYIDGDNSYWLFYNVSNILNSVFLSSCTCVYMTFVLWTSTPK